MCGIAGFYGFKNDNLIKQFSKDLEHRGPDGEGYYIDENVSLLNRRLAIIDRKGGDQPIYNEDKTLTVVYNGEIYNYMTLRTALEEKGHKFKTKSDTEIIVHGYEEWGDESFNMYNGMFAIGLYDIKNERLILVRDHFGIKPLYYSPSPFIFASEIKPLIYSGLVEKVPNDRIIYRYLNYRVHDDQDETFFKGIYKLMPGEMMTIDKDGVKKKLFSHLEKEILRLPIIPKSKDTVPEFKSHIIDSIEMRLISEVPVGSALSGGLDSSTVVAVINKLLKEHSKDATSVGKNQNTFSAVFPRSSNNEEVYIDKLLDKLEGVRSHKIYPKPEEFFQEIEDFVRTQEEPTISTGPYAQYKVMQEARKFVTVLLDGQGSDEMMAGYIPYYFVYLNQLKKQGKFFTLVKEVWGARDVVAKYLWMELCNKKTVSPRSLLNQKFVEAHADETFTVTNTNLKKRLIEDIFHNSLPALLRYEDKNSMRFSIEGRVPFLDFNLLGYIFTHEDKTIIENGWNKNILRNAMKDLLPPSITWRRNKIGFTAPEYEWFMRMKNKVYSYFLSGSFEKRKYFNQSQVLKAFEEFIQGKNGETMLFWRILNLELWLQIFFDPPSAKATGDEARSFLSPNPGKELKIVVDRKTYFRFPVTTDVFQKGDNLAQKVTKHLLQFLTQFSQKKQFHKLQEKAWFLVISEKIVAISQGRSYFIWDIKAGFWANTLSKFVSKTPYGIGLGSPWTMQLAMNEVGIPRILLASIVGAIGKLVGAKGLFYRLAGGDVRAIDGPTEYSLYPSNVSAKLPPKNPGKVVSELHEELLQKLPKSKARTFKGVVIVDANDLGRNVMGNSTSYSNTLIEQMFKDNPMGQAAEQTPLVVVYTE